MAPVSEEPLTLLLLVVSKALEFCQDTYISYIPYIETMMWMNKGVRVAALALLGLQAARPVGANLNQLAKAAGKLYFGSATDNSELSDSAYKAILYVFSSSFPLA